MSENSYANFIVYPQGEARPVVVFDRLVDMMTEDQLVYLSGKIAAKMFDLANPPTGDKNGLDNP